MGPCIRDEVLVLNNSLARLSPWATSFSLHKTALEQGGVVQQSSYKATWFIRPHKNMTCGQYHSKLAHRGQNGTSLIDTGGGYHIGASDNHDPLPTLPIQVLHFSLFAPSSHTNKHQYKTSTKAFPIIPLVKKWKVLRVSGIYHSTSIDI
jgi:hypothetical protein